MKEDATVAMETVAVNDEVSVGDVQHEEATENMMSPEEGEGNAIQVEDAAEEPETVTEVSRDGRDHEDLTESEATLRRQSLDGGTEPPQASSLSPEPGRRHLSHRRRM